MSKQNDQNTPAAVQAGGGNITGKSPSYARYLVPKFMGRAGTGDTNDTFRKNGK